MFSKSERSFGSRIEKAKKLKTLISGFTNYQPETGEFSIDDLQQSIEIAENLNPQVATALFNYRQVVAQRREIYTKSPLSIKKIITPVNAFFRAKFGKTSSNYLTTKSLVAKIRGVKLKSQAKVDEETHSVSQQSYGSILLNFQNLINDIEALELVYNPVNVSIKLDKLIDLKILAQKSNDDVTEAFGILTPKQDQRLAAFKTLSEKAQRIKDYVQSQYGINSSEYKLVKGLNI
jgi:hypothetical protein